MFSSVFAPIRGNLRTSPSLQACSSCSIVEMPSFSCRSIAVFGPTSGTDISVVIPSGSEARSSS
jgi:hypothetical protein